MLFNSLKVSALSLVAVIALAGAVSSSALAQTTDLGKDIHKEQKNVLNESAQKKKKHEAQHKLSQDRAEGRNGVVVAKDKMIVGLHKHRLHHEVKRGAKLRHKMHKDG